MGIGHDEGTWCYVSKECENLNGGARSLRAPVSWKRCAAFVDSSLRDNTPEALLDLAKEHDVAFNILDKYAYSGQRGGEAKYPIVHTWDFADGRVPQQMTPFMESREPLVFDTHNDGHVPHVIIFNNKVYRVDYDLPDDEHPGNWARLGCI